MEDHQQTTNSVLPTNFSSGPYGLGDPDDRSLRKVETEILIPQKMRDKARIEKCVPEVKAFESCCKASGLSMVIKCRTENAFLKECLTKWYGDEQFKRQCTEEYLNERAEYRKTGISKKKRRKEPATF